MDTDSSLKRLLSVIVESRTAYHQECATLASLLWFQTSAELFSGWRVLLRETLLLSVDENSHKPSVRCSAVSPDSWFLCSPVLFKNIYSEKCDIPVHFFFFTLKSWNKLQPQVGHTVSSIVSALNMKLNIYILSKLLPLNASSVSKFVFKYFEDSDVNRSHLSHRAGVQPAECAC